MKRTTVVYEEGTGGMIRSVVTSGLPRQLDDGLEFEWEVPERRVPARLMTTWVPAARIIRIDTEDI